MSKRAAAMEGTLRGGPSSRRHMRRKRRDMMHVQVCLVLGVLGITWGVSALTDGEVQKTRCSCGFYRFRDTGGNLDISQSNGLRLKDVDEGRCEIGR